MRCRALHGSPVSSLVLHGSKLPCLRQRLQTSADHQLQCRPYASCMEQLYRQVSPQALPAAGRGPYRKGSRTPTQALTGARVLQCALRPGSGRRQQRRAGPCSRWWTACRRASTFTRPRRCARLLNVQPAAVVPACTPAWAEPDGAHLHSGQPAADASVQLVYRVRARVHSFPGCSGCYRALRCGRLDPWTCRMILTETAACVCRCCACLIACWTWASRWSASFFCKPFPLWWRSGTLL